MTQKVIWKEGTFILPQHFQQQERFMLGEMHQRLSTIQPYGYGFSKLAIAESELGFGQFSLDKCHALFQDGTVIDAPQINRLPPAIKLEDGLSNAIVYLVLPARVANVNEIKTADETHGVSRFIPHTISVSDSSSSDTESAAIEVGDVHCTLMVETPEEPIPDGYMKLAVAQVKEVISGNIILSDDFIGQIINTRVSDKITRFLKELSGMLSARGDSLGGQSNRLWQYGRRNRVF